MFYNSIFLFVSSLDKGGLEMYLLRFLKLKEFEFENIYVICKHGRTGILNDDFSRIPNVSIITLKLSYFNFSKYFKLYRLLKSSGVSTVCDFTGDFAGLVLWIAKLAHVKQRITFYRGSAYQFSMTSFKQVYVRFLRSILSISATKYLSNSYYALDVFQPNWRNDVSNKYQVIYNGVPDTTIESSFCSQLLKTNLGLSKIDFIVGHVGNFREAKNHNAFVETAKLTISHIPNIKFLLIGNGVQEGLLPIIQRSGLESYFVMPGSMSNIPELLSIMDVFFFPSINEGQPNSLIEAMIHKVPILTSNIPTILECLPEYLSSHTFDSDDYESFSEFLVQASNSNFDPVLLTTVSEYCKIKFSPENRFTEFLNVLYEN